VSGQRVIAIAKRLAVGLCAAALAVAAASADDLPRRSFKGWELYAWQDGGGWKFSLLVGTNRIKFCDEMKNPKGALDLAQAEAALDRLAELEWVSLWLLPELQRRCGITQPPAHMMERLGRACARQGRHCEGFGAASDNAPRRKWIAAPETHT
jgi:hypothetical protein